MRYIKTYEKIKAKNIEVGRIYRIPSFTFSSLPGWNMIPLGKVLSLGENKNWMSVKIFFENGQEHITNITRDRLLNIASPEEIERFEMLENTKKYNL